jgi:hypothetical protein
VEEGVAGMDESEGCGGGDDMENMVVGERAVNVNHSFICKPIDLYLRVRI